MASNQDVHFRCVMCLRTFNFRRNALRHMLAWQQQHNVVPIADHQWITFPDGASILSNWRRLEEETRPATLASPPPRPAHTWHHLPLIRLHLRRCGESLNTLLNGLQLAPEYEVVSSGEEGGGEAQTVSQKRRAGSGVPSQPSSPTGPSPRLSAECSTARTPSPRPGGSQSRKGGIKRSSKRPRIPPSLIPGGTAMPQAAGVGGAHGQMVPRGNPRGWGGVLLWMFPQTAEVGPSPGALTSQAPGVGGAACSDDVTGPWGLALGGACWSMTSQAPGGGGEAPALMASQGVGVGGAPDTMATQAPGVDGTPVTMASQAPRVGGAPATMASQAPGVGGAPVTMGVTGSWG